jgi:multiple sugar transport system substrate-binding protein
MKFEFVPWTNYADRFLNELNSKGKLCDLIIGDSQWIGGAAENGHYVKLNDFFAKEGIKMDDFMPATVVGYSNGRRTRRTTGRCRRWATRSAGPIARTGSPAGAAGRVQGRNTARSRPPKTWDELKQIAEFFQGREIDGKKVYGASIYTERGSEGITMGVTNALYDYGFKYEDPNKPYEMEGFVNSPDAVKGLEFYKALYKCCTPPGHEQAYMARASTPSSPARSRCR